MTNKSEEGASGNPARTARGDSKGDVQQGFLGELDVTTQAVPRAVEPGDDERKRVADQIASRLHGRGVRLHGRESGEELVTLLEAVERFEAVVESRGGDLMVDQPIGEGVPLAPDVRAFVLPLRGEKESIADFIGRIAEATARAKEAGSD